MADDNMEMKDLSSESDLDELRVVDLKKELEKRGLAKSGTKKELIDRLRKHLQAVEAQHSETKNTSKDDEESRSSEGTEVDSGDEVGGKGEPAGTNGGNGDGPNITVTKIVSPEKIESSREGRQDDSDESDREEKRRRADSSSSSDSEPEQKTTVRQERRGRDESSDSDDEQESSVMKQTKRAESRDRTRSRSPVGKESRDSSRSRSAVREGSRNRSRSRSPVGEESRDRSRSRSPMGEESRDRSRSRSPERVVSGKFQDVGKSGEGAEQHKKTEERRKEDKEEKPEKEERRQKSAEGHTSEIHRTTTPASDNGSSVNKQDVSVVREMSAESLNHSISEDSSGKAARKRRWGSTANKSSTAVSKPTFNISTESLKGLIPEITAASFSKAPEPVLDLLEPFSQELEGSESSDTGEEPKRERVETPPRVVKERKRKSSSQEDDGERGEEMEEGEVVEGGTRTVEMRGEQLMRGTQSEDDDDKINQENREPVTVTIIKKPITAPLRRDSTGKPSSGSSTGRLVNVLPHADEPTTVRGRKGSPSPSRHTPSTVLLVTGLVRPYTLNQLKELLGRTGTLIEGGFWIDKIKSFCYVVYETVEQATATRKSLHGKKWPLSNPKVLDVDFSTTENMERAKEREGPTPGVIRRPSGATSDAARRDSRAAEESSRRKNAEQEVKRSDKEGRGSRGRRESRDEKKSSAQKPLFPVREWDRDKRSSRSRSPLEGRGRRDEKQRDERRPREAERVKEKPDEPPAKLLDDLFRKTKTLPCIYWLPLTEEQISAREARLAEQETERARVRAEREQQRIQAEQERMQHDRKHRGDGSYNKVRDSSPAGHRDAARHRGEGRSERSRNDPPARGHSKSRRDERQRSGRH